MGHHRIGRTAGLALALVALGAPTAFAQQQDLRSPDARGTSVAPPAIAPQSDMRSPDARASAGTAADVTAERDWAAYPSPDSAPASAPEPPAAQPVPVPADDTPSLPVTVAIAGALLLVAASATRFGLRRRRTAGSAA